MKAWTCLFLMAFMLVGCVIDSHDEWDDGGSRGADLQVGDKLPSFFVEVVNGDSRRMFFSKALTGKTVLVFFHTGCVDCQRELPLLNDYYLRHRDEVGFQMVAIAREESEESILRFWQQHSLSIPYSPQSDRAIFNLFASSTIPRVYICSPQGVIEWMGVEQFTLPL